MKNWKLFHPFDEPTHFAMNQQHSLAKLIGLVGTSYLPEEPDFGHASLFFLPDLKVLTTKQLIGNRTFSIAFSLFDLRFLILDQSYNTIDEFSMEGKKALDAFEWMKFKLGQFNLDQKKIKSSYNKSDPSKFTDIENPISINSSALKENVKLRANANLILQKYASRFEHASEVRIWPHHFDTATYIPLRFNEDKKETHSIGLGFATPDITVNEPYFYINTWSASGLVSIKNPEKLKGHGKWSEKDWIGAILPISTIIEKDNAEEQWKRINRFFESGIITILNSF